MSHALARMPQLVCWIALATGLAPLVSGGEASAQVLKPFEAVIRPHVDAGELAGVVVLVSDKERDLAIEAVGFADVANRTPMRADTVFWIASISKPVTAAALMVLVDDGKVGLDDPVTKYLPEFKDQWVVSQRMPDKLTLTRPARPVTIRHLLSHTSGMPFKSALEDPTLDALPLRDRVRGYAMTPLQSEPGDKYEYSNAGINTAGRVIEVVSGLSFAEFLRQRLLDPLGMAETTFWPTSSQVKRAAKAYKPKSGDKAMEETPIGQLQYPLDGPGREPMPAGGLFSTAADMSVFGRMVLNGGTHGGKRVLSADAVRQMTTAQTAGDKTLNYGLGWATNGRTFGHGGTLGTDLSVDSKAGLVTVYLVQQAGSVPGRNCQGDFKKAAAEKFAPPAK